MGCFSALYFLEYYLELALKGEFAGYKDCTIGAVADKSGMICKVSVIFPAMDK